MKYRFKGESIILIIVIISIFKVTNILKLNLRKNV